MGVFSAKFTVTAVPDGHECRLTQPWVPSSQKVPSPPLLPTDHSTSAKRNKQINKNKKQAWAKAVLLFTKQAALMSQNCRTCFPLFHAWFSLLKIWLLFQGGDDKNWLRKHLNNKKLYLDAGTEARLLSAQVIKYPNSSSVPLICLKSFNRKYDAAFKTT